MTALETIAAPIGAALLALAVLAAVFTAVGAWACSCNDTGAWWRKPDLGTDVCYALVLPGLMQLGRVGCLIVGLAALYGVTDLGAAAAMMDGVPGPLSHLGFWAQTAVYLAAGDLFLYATHRAFHGAGLWRYHAVHHSSEQVEWISAQRIHPFDVFWHAVIGDCLLLLLGISPGVLVSATPFTIGMSALVHANLDWTFGPFRYVLTSPVFHRWHHTGIDRGGNSNFAANFPVLDLIFGTFYMPVGQMPEGFGVTERDVAPDFGGQMLHPFRLAAPAPPSTNAGPHPLPAPTAPRLRIARPKPASGRHPAP